MNDTHIVMFFLSGTIMLVLFAFFIVAYLIVQKQKQHAHILEKNRMDFDHQNKLLIARMKEKEDTMSQISREIHDNIGGLLNFMKMNIHAITRHATDTRQLELIDSHVEILDTVIKDTRNISHTLNSDYIRALGLSNAIKEELEYVKISQKINAVQAEIGSAKRYNPDSELLIYRIAQEAIHNITKHSQANNMEVTLTYLSDSFMMAITDDGVGFDMEKLFELKGTGFMNMMQRAKILDADLNINSQPFGGSVISLVIPNIEQVTIDYRDPNITIKDLDVVVN